MQQVELDEVAPAVAEGSFVAPNATLAGKVAVYDGASVWYNAAIEADAHPAVLGFKSALLDGAVLQSTADTPASVGHFATIGANAVVSGASVGDSVVVGSSASIGEGAVVGSGAVIQDGAAVAPGTHVPAGEVWGGSPAQFVRKASEGDAINAAGLYEANAAKAQAHASEFVFSTEVC